jgi:hypothetical protein
MFDAGETHPALLEVNNIEVIDEVAEAHRRLLAVRGASLFCARTCSSDTTRGRLSTSPAHLRPRRRPPPGQPASARSLPYRRPDSMS